MYSLCNEHFLFNSSFLYAVTLSPGNATTLACASGSVQFTCTAPLAAVWTTTGFVGDGTNLVSAFGQNLAESSRIETMDMNLVAATSIITVHDFSLGDQDAIVACVNGQDSMDRVQTRIDIG